MGRRRGGDLGGHAGPVVADREDRSGRRANWSRATRFWSRTLQPSPGPSRKGRGIRQRPRCRCGRLHFGRTWLRASFRMTARRATLQLRRIGLDRGQGRQPASRRPAQRRLLRRGRQFTDELSISSTRRTSTSRGCGGRAKSIRSAIISCTRLRLRVDHGQLAASLGILLVTQK